MKALRSAVKHFVVEFGPGRSPPRPIISLLLGMIQQAHPDLYVHFDPDSGWSQARLRELVIAYGCRFRKVDLLGLEEWHGTWPKARQAFTSLVEVWVKKTARWLEFDAAIYGLERANQLVDDAQVTAVITFLLLNGQCQCFGRAVQQEAEFSELGIDCDEDQNDNRCLTEHSLLAWDPSQMSLAAFVARAVKGSLTSKESGKQLFSTGGLLQGLFYQVRGRALGLRAGQVLLWRCPRDGARNIYGLACRICRRHSGHLVEALTDARLMTTRRIVLPSAIGGSFHPVKLWKCRHCGRRYPTMFRACPSDARTPGRGEKPSVVWICTSGPNVELDAESDEEEGDDQNIAESFYLPGNQLDMPRLLDAKALLPTLTGNQRLELMALLEAYL